MCPTIFQTGSITEYCNSWLLIILSQYMYHVLMVIRKMVEI